MKFEDNGCICGATASRPLFDLADWNFGNSTARATMYRCEACGSLFPDRFPTSETIGEAYRHYYTAPVARRGVRRLSRWLLDALQGAMRDRHAPAQARSLLDFGCGSGEFLAAIAARRPGLACAGSDVIAPDEPARLPFRWLAPDLVRQGNERFDHVTLSHVVEHVHDPRALLRDMARLLAPGGTLWIATPNADSFLFPMLKGRARDSDFPRHRQIFSRAALTTLLREAGLEPEFQAAPLVNGLLNLKSGLANQRRPPMAATGDRPSGAALAWRTIEHGFAGRSVRMAEAPEMIVIARAAAIEPIRR